MGFKLQALKLGVELLLYVLDIVTDIYVLTKYYQEGEIVWFSLTLACLVISSVIVNITAFRNRDEELGDRVYFVALVGQMCVIVRYVEQFIILKRYSTDKLAAHKLDQVRYTEALSESAPQWCIQTYVMLRLWSFPWYAIASTIVSLLSVIWGFVSVRMSHIELELEREREGKDEHIDHPFVLAIVLFVSQLGFLISRLSLIAILAFYLTEHDLIEHILTYAVVSVFMLRLLILLACGIAALFITMEIDEIWSLTKILFISFFDVTISQGQFGKWKVKFARFLYFLEGSVGLTSICLISTNSDFANIEFMKYLALGLVLGGVGIGILFFAIYYKVRDYVIHNQRRNREKDSVTLDVGQNRVQETGTRPTHDRSISLLYLERDVSVTLRAQETRTCLSSDNQGYRDDRLTQHVEHHQGNPSPQDNQSAWHTSRQNHFSSISPQVRRDSDTFSHCSSSPHSAASGEETWSDWLVKQTRWLFGT